MVFDFLQKMLFKKIQSNDCVLIDAGCDYSGYISDITRNFPICGEFSNPQRVLYEALCELQKKLIKYVKERRPLRLDRLYLYMLEEMRKILKEVSFFNTSLNDEELLRVS